MHFFRCQITAIRRGDLRGYSPALGARTIINCLGGSAGLESGHENRVTPQYITIISYIMENR